jgi:hypothetical protein
VVSNLIRDETRECRQVFKPAAGEGLCPFPESEAFFESSNLARGEMAEERRRRSLIQGVFEDFPQGNLLILLVLMNHSES